MRALLFRLNALRMNGPIALLLVTLQRTPVLQAIVRLSPRIPFTSAGIVRSAVLAVAGEATVHSLTGATRFTTNPAVPTTAKVGTSFTLVFSVTGTPSIAQSYWVSGTIPPGLSVPRMSSSGVLNASSGSITGIPTQAGSYTAYVTAFSGTNLYGFSNYVKYPIAITVSSGSTTPEAPAITSQPQSLTLTEGTSGSFHVTATGYPAPAYQWTKDSTNIPGATDSTLSFTGVQASDAGNYAVVVSNASGSVMSNTVPLTVNPPPPVPPSIALQPQSLSLLAGQPATLSALANGTPSPTYQWQKNGVDIPGATTATLSFASVHVSDSGDYDVVATNSSGTAQSYSASLSVIPLTISRQPQSLMLPTGYPGSMTVVATAPLPLQYQWLKDGTPVPGATSQTFSLASAQAADAGSYTVAVSTTEGTVVSDPASVVVGSNGGRLVNLSCRGEVGTGAQVLIPGMYFSGTAKKRLLIRAVGPTLANAPYNVTGTLQDPVLAIFDSSGTQIASNDNWGDNGAEGGLSSLFQQVGAFALPPGSKDAAIAIDLPPNGGFTYLVSDKNGGTGVALVEIYEVDQTGRISNLSTRGFVGSGSALLIPGVVSIGTKPKSLLIRAVGPTLGDAPFNVPGVLQDPVLHVMDSGGREILSNDDWNSAPNLDAVRLAMQHVGAFALAEGSKDAVVLAALPPGLYTFLVTGKSGASGVALVEVYEVPDAP